MEKSIVKKDHYGQRMNGDHGPSVWLSARDKQFCLTCFAIAKDRPGCAQNHKIILVSRVARAPKKDASKREWLNFIKRFVWRGPHLEIALKTLEKR